MLVHTEAWGGDRECTDQEVCLYAQKPGKEIESALTRRWEEIVSALTWYKFHTVHTETWGGKRMSFNPK